MGERPLDADWSLACFRFITDDAAFSCNSLKTDMKVVSGVDGWLVRLVAFAAGSLISPFVGCKRGRTTVEYIIDNASYAALQ